MTKNSFLFHLKSFFRSQDIYIFVLTRWSFRKNGLIKNIRLVLKFKILRNISQSKGNQTIKFGQIIEYK